jgi:hypothetical protein
MPGQNTKPSQPHPDTPLRNHTQKKKDETTLSNPTSEANQLKE